MVVAASSVGWLLFLFIFCASMCVCWCLDTVGGPEPVAPLRLRCQGKFEY